MFVHGWKPSLWRKLMGRKDQRGLRTGFAEAWIRLVIETTEQRCWPCCGHPSRQWMERGL
jgi:hypothetical protein